MFMPHWPIILGRKPVTFGLQRIEKLLKFLGNPHHNLPPIIHVAGTNGKGSVLAFLKAIFNSAGLTTHRYTSPHLFEFNERIMINDKNISDSDLYMILEECRYVTEKNNLEITFFEGVTAAAILAFSRKPADILLLETGMGGRLDPTNIINNPLATIITSISYDHTEQLGQTLPEIAFQKAGILKKNSKCIISLQTEEVLNILINSANSLNIDPFIFSYDFSLEINEDKSWNYLEKDLKLNLPKPGLLGVHQYINAATAIATIYNILDFFPAINARNIKEGVENVIWPSRLEKIKSGRLIEILNKKYNGAELYIDGAHNPNGAQILSEWIKEENLNTYLPTYLILGLTKNRNPTDFLKFFQNIVQGVIGIKVTSEPNSLFPGEIKKAADILGINGDTCLNIEDAINNIALVNESSIRIIVTGSLFLSSILKEENKIL